MKIRWNYSDNWTRGIFTLRHARHQQKNDSVNSTLKGILTLNPFGTSAKIPKKLASEEFMTFRYPKSKLKNQ